MAPVHEQVKRLNELFAAWRKYRAPLGDPDDSMNVAVEHYFLCRCWVGKGVQSAWQMRAMHRIYDLGNMAGGGSAPWIAKPPTF
jgi:hypothetical protein